MIRSFFAAFVLLKIACVPAFAQSFDERIRAIEQNNKSLEVWKAGVSQAINDNSELVRKLAAKVGYQQGYNGWDPIDHAKVSLPSLPAVSAPVCDAKGCSPQMTLQAFQPTVQASGSCGSSGGFFARIAERRAARRGW